MSPQPQHPSPHISLTVKTTAGTWQDARFNGNNRVQKILDDAIEHFTMDPTPPRPYQVVRDGSEAPLALDQKIEDVGLHDRDTVVIKVPRPTDG
jgi:hypothetical protein